MPPIVRDRQPVNASPGRRVTDQRAAGGHGEPGPRAARHRRQPSMPVRRVAEPIVRPGVRPSGHQGAGSRRTAGSRTSRPDAPASRRSAEASSRTAGTLAAGRPADRGTLAQPFRRDAPAGGRPARRKCADRTRGQSRSRLARRGRPVRMTARRAAMARGATTGTAVRPAWSPGRSRSRAAAPSRTGRSEPRVSEAQPSGRGGDRGSYSPPAQSGGGSRGGGGGDRGGGGGGGGGRRR